MTDRERLAFDFKYKAEQCHIAWTAFRLARVGEPLKSENSTALWAKFADARKELRAAYTKLNEENPLHQLGPFEWYYV